MMICIKKDNDLSVEDSDLSVNYSTVICVKRTMICPIDYNDEAR